MEPTANSQILSQWWTYIGPVLGFFAGSILKGLFGDRLREKANAYWKRRDDMRLPPSAMALLLGLIQTDSRRLIIEWKDGRSRKTWVRIGVGERHQQSDVEIDKDTVHCLIDKGYLKRLSSHPSHAISEKVGNTTTMYHPDHYAVEPKARGHFSKHK